MGRAINPVRRCSLFGATIMLTLHQSPFDLSSVSNSRWLPPNVFPTPRWWKPMSPTPFAWSCRVLSAERRSALDGEAEKPALLSEFRTGTWSRSFRFPTGLDRDQLKATYRDGILEISAGKAVSHTSVTVTVES